MPSAAQELRIRKLEPETRRRYRQLLARLKARGIRVHTGQTARGTAQQARLVAAGKSGTTRSWHLLRRAIDAYPLAGGRPDYKATKPEQFRAMHQEAARLGFRGLAYSPYPDGPKRWIQTSKGRVWDAGHIEYRGGMTFAQAAAATPQLAGLPRRRFRRRRRQRRVA